MFGEEEQVHNSLYFGYVIISCLMFECFFKFNPYLEWWWLLKEMGDGTYWFIACYAQNTPMIN